MNKDVWTYEGPFQGVGYVIKRNGYVNGYCGTWFGARQVCWELNQKEPTR
jgi:hypothetical protein